MGTIPKTLKEKRQEQEARNAALVDRIARHDKKLAESARKILCVSKSTKKGGVMDAPERVFVQMDYPDQCNLAFMAQCKQTVGRIEYTRADIPAARIAELEAENARLRGALSIYANVVSDYASDSELASDPAYDWLNDDAGSVARAALDKGEG